ncbi:MAG: LytTR family DNA-binding domain-containing protein [Bacteroidota bacterium]
MTTLRCFIVDDERLARLELSALLEEHGGCTVVGEAANATTALDLLSRQPVDVIFLDINMPGTNGFELLTQLGGCPPVVFVTAYDQFAIRAFEVNALDYLLKPVRADRLAATLDRLHPHQGPETDQRLFLPNRSGGRFVELNDIYLIRAYDHYVRLYHPAGNDLLHQSLGGFAERLPPEKYFQANRSEIVQLSAVHEVGKQSRGRYQLHLPGNEVVVVSERRSVEWRGRFK